MTAASNQNYCIFCGNVILTKTRKGLWKTGMNKHWLLNHSEEFAEAEDHDGNGQEMVCTMPTERNL
jgi:hypothetical protein